MNDARIDEVVLGAAHAEEGDEFIGVARRPDQLDHVGVVTDNDHHGGPAHPGHAVLEERGHRFVWVTAAVALSALVVAALWNASELAAWYRTWTLFERIPDNAQGYREYRHRRTGIVFVRIPGGSFAMGMTPGEIQRVCTSFPEDIGIAPFSPGSPDQLAELEPFLAPHAVTVSPLFIAKYEVTQREWQGVMGDLPRLLLSLDDRPKGDENPVEQVSWFEARRFCDRTGLDLPTEAEWEYACRGGSTEMFWGPAPLEEISWYRANSGDKNHPVGQKAPNGFGIHDMQGNVEEWCLDEFDPTFYTQAAARAPDPLSRSGPGTKVKRGGNYGSFANSLAPGSRSNEGPDSQGHGTGLRPVYRVR